MPIPYPGEAAANARSNLAALGNGATPGQVAKTALRDNTNAVVLTGNFQVIALGVENIVNGNKVIISGTVVADVTAASATVTLFVLLAVDGVQVGPTFEQSAPSDAGKVTVSFTYEVAAPLPGSRSFDIQAKHDDSSSMTVQAHAGIMVEQIVNV